MIPVHAVITTHDRPDDLRDCVAALAPQVHHVIVIDNASDPRVSHDIADTVLYDKQQPPNLSRLWNVGLRLSRKVAQRSRAPLWDTLVVNDDFIVGPGFVERLQDALRKGDAAVASPFVYGNLGGSSRPPDVVDTPGTLTDMSKRMAGFAWMTRGEFGLMADTDIRWWYGDDDIAQKAAELSSRVVVHGLAWEHRHPDQSTRDRPELAERAHRDRLAFVSAWGFQPW